MGGAKKSTWVGGTVFIGLLIAAASWFLAISPTMAAAAELRTQAADTRQQNELLEMRVTKLRADFAKLPEYRAQLAALQVQIPTSAMLADYLRQLDQIAVVHSVNLVSIAPSTPLGVVPAVPPAAAPAPAPTEPAATGEGEAAADGTAAVVPAAPGVATVPAGFAAIPFSLTVIGTYDNTLAFVSDLQNATARLFLVSGLVGTAQHEGDAAAGRPATAEGDQELIITGFTYVLPDGLGVPATVDPNAAPPALPGAVPGKNPYIAVGGS